MPNPPSSRIWLLEPIDSDSRAWQPWYDKAFGFVVRAATEAEARQFAHENGGDESCDDGHCLNPWLDAAQSSCVELTGDGAKGVVIRNYASA